MTKIHNSHGQMLLVVVLTMIVALTVGLSIVSRTITDLRISRQNEESQRAFQAAEAGIERALQSSEGVSDVPFSNNAEYSTVISNPSGTEFLLNAGELVDQDTGIDLWLSDYPDHATPRSGTITIYWANSATQTECGEGSGSATRAALEVVILSGSPASPSLSKYVYDGCSRIQSASAPGAGGQTAGVNFAYGAAIPVTNGLIARVIPIFNSTVVGVSYAPLNPAGPELPQQGTIVESTGVSGETVRKVQYFSSHPQIPLEIFPYSLISQ